MFSLVVSGLSELPLHKDGGFTHIISLLDDGSEFEVGDNLFEDYHPHQRLLLKFDDVSYPNQYYVAPTHEDVETILEFAKSIGETDRVLVHCVAGVSRSTAAASLLLLQAYPEMTAHEVFEEVVRIRPIAIPNFLILQHGGRILDRFDEIIEAYKMRFSSIR